MAAQPDQVGTDLPESHGDLLEAAGVGALATIAPDGRPQVTAVWYLLEDGRLKISIRTDRQKAKNLTRQPGATFLIIDPAKTTRTIEVRATAELTPDDGYAFANRIGAKYGLNLNEFDPPGSTRYVVTLRPDRVISRG
jgi:PPOX class probable F420-dependent enzyme